MQSQIELKSLKHYAHQDLHFKTKDDEEMILLRDRIVDKLDDIQKDFPTLNKCLHTFSIDEKRKNKCYFDFINTIRRIFEYERSKDQYGNDKFPAYKDRKVIASFGEGVEIFFNEYLKQQGFNIIKYNAGPSILDKIKLDMLIAGTNHFIDAKGRLLRDGNKNLYDWFSLYDNEFNKYSKYVLNGCLDDGTLVDDIWIAVYHNYFNPETNACYIGEKFVSMKFILANKDKHYLVCNKPNSTDINLNDSLTINQFKKEMNII